MSPAAASAPRRSTRSSIARFAYTTSTRDNDDDDGDSDGSAPTSPDAASELSYGSDIEDAITRSPPARSRARQAARVVTGKRKRTTTVTSAPASATTAASKKKTARGSTVKTEIETEVTTTETTAAPKAAAARRVRKPARLVTDPETGARTVQPPSDWEAVYAAAKEMRLPGGRAAGAAVDTMGCERLADPAASARDRRFHTLVALMLSSQTKDTVNAEAMGRLRREMPAHKPGAPAGLNLDNMLAVDPALLNELIGKVGFHNNKTKFLKQAAVLLRDRHGGDIPDTIEGLTSLPGVGPKMAHLCMSADNGWGRVEGVGVDVHVHRITNLWGWQGSPPSRTPEETRLALQAWLPRDRWKEINWLLVGLGQTVCLPVGRKCGECEVGLRGLCKSAERKKVLEGLKRRREVEVKKTEKEHDVVLRVKGDGDGEEEQEVDGAVVIKTEEVAVVDEVVGTERDVIVNEEVDNVVKKEEEEVEPSPAPPKRRRPAR